MSPFQLMLVAMGIFAAVFGGLILAQKALSKEGELAVADGPAPTAKPAAAPEADTKTADLERRLKQAGIAMDAATYKKRVMLFTMFGGALGMAMGSFKLGGILFGAFLAYGAFKGGDFYIT